jgi:hypothetical protein
MAQVQRKGKGPKKRKRRLAPFRGMNYEKKKQLVFGGPVRGGASGGGLRAWRSRIFDHHHRGGRHLLYHRRDRAHGRYDCETATLDEAIARFTFDNIEKYYSLSVDIGYRKTALPALP